MSAPKTLFFETSKYACLSHDALLTGLPEVGPDRHATRLSARRAL